MNRIKKAKPKEMSDKPRKALRHGVEFKGNWTIAYEIVEGDSVFGKYTTNYKTRTTTIRIQGIAGKTSPAEIGAIISASDKLLSEECISKKALDPRPDHNGVESYSGVFYGRFEDAVPEAGKNPKCDACGKGA